MINKAPTAVGTIFVLKNPIWPALPNESCNSANTFDSKERNSKSVMTNAIPRIAEGIRINHPMVLYR